MHEATRRLASLHTRTNNADDLLTSGMDIQRKAHNLEKADIAVEAMECSGYTRSYVGSRADPVERCIGASFVKWAENMSARAYPPMAYTSSKYHPGVSLREAELLLRIAAQLRSSTQRARLPWWLSAWPSRQYGPGNAPSPWVQSRRCMLNLTRPAPKLKTCGRSRASALASTPSRTAEVNIYYFEGNHGHCETAIGVTDLLKVSCMLEQQRIPL